MKKFAVSLTVALSAAVSLLAQTKATIPVAGSATGAFGSHFKTEVQLNNRSAQPMSGKLVFHPQGVSATANDPFVDYSLAPHQTLEFDDVVASLGATGLGSIDLIPNGKGIPAVVARAFDDKGTSGTTGAAIPLVTSGEFGTTGDRFTLVAPLDRTRFRFNIGVRSLSEGASLRMTVYSPQGVALTTVGPLQYAADYFVQRTAEDLLGTTLTGDESIEVEVVSGRAIVYGTTTDNTTNDPSIQISVRSPR